MGAPGCSSVLFCSKTISSTHGGQYTALLPGCVVPRNDVASRWTLAYSAGGCEFLFHGQSCYCLSWAHRIVRPQELLRSAARKL